MPEFSFEMFIINLVSKYCISQTAILYSKCFGFFLLRKKKKRFFSSGVKVSVSISGLYWNFDMVLGAANANVLLKCISRCIFTSVNWCASPMKHMKGEA